MTYAVTDSFALFCRPPEVLCCTFLSLVTTRHILSRYACIYGSLVDLYTEQHNRILPFPKHKYQPVFVQIGISTFDGDHACKVSVMHIQPFVKRFRHRKAPIVLFFQKQAKQIVAPLLLCMTCTPRSSHWSSFDQDTQFEISRRIFLSLYIYICIALLVLQLHFGRTLIISNAPQLLPDLSVGVVCACVFVVMVCMCACVRVCVSYIGIGIFRKEVVTKPVILKTIPYSF